MELRPSQYNPGQEIPEKSLAYRLAKYFFFNDYGTYGKHFDAAKWIDSREKPAAAAAEAGANRSVSKFCRGSANPAAANTSSSWRQIRHPASRCNCAARRTVGQLVNRSPNADKIRWRNDD